jgi:hypothetical protein
MTFYSRAFISSNRFLASGSVAKYLSSSAQEYLSQCAQFSTPFTIAHFLIWQFSQLENNLPPFIVQPSQSVTSSTRVSTP